MVYIGGDGGPGGEGSSSNPGGSSNPNPGGGNKPPSTSYNPDSLVRDTSSNTLDSNVSYSSDDIKRATTIKYINIERIMDNPSLSNGEKKKQVLEIVNKLSNDLVEAKQEVKNIKTSGNIPVIFKK